MVPRRANGGTESGGGRRSAAAAGGPKGGGGRRSAAAAGGPKSGGGRRSVAAALLFAGDDWLVDALDAFWFAAGAGGCLAFVSPSVAAEHGGPRQRRWSLPAADATVARVGAELERVAVAVVDLVVAFADVADWQNAAGDSLWRGLAAARAAASWMRGGAGGLIALVAVDRSDAPPAMEADVVRAGAITMAHGLAKAVGDEIRVCALVSGPVEETRASGRRTRYAVDAAAVAQFIVALSANDAWSSGSVFHLGSDLSRSSSTER